MKPSKRTLVAILFVTGVILAMFAWDELGGLYEVAPVHGRLLSYALIMLGGWVGGSTLFDARGAFKRFTESTLPSWFVPMMGAAVFAEAIERGMGVHWAITSFAVFHRYLLLYLAGSACAGILSYRRHPKTADSGT